MSSAVVSTSAAQSRLFIFDDESAPELSCHPEGPVEQNKSGCPTSGRFCQKWGFPDFRQSLSKGPLPSTDPRLAHITPASHLAIRPAPEVVPSGIAALDTLTGGLPRGCITEICGPASSGRTSLLLTALSAATRRAECCALIDATDAFDPHFTTAAAIDLDRLLWVRCGDSSPKKTNSPQRSRSVILSAAKDPLQNGGGNGLSRNFYDCPAESALLNNLTERLPQRTSKVQIQSGARQSEHCLEQLLRATDLLLESGGFGLIALDLADVPAESARRIPLTTWFRFRRAIEHTPTILLVIEPQPIAGSCSSLVLQLRSTKNSGASDSWKQLGSSRKAAAWESPARQCRVGIEKKNESCKDGIPDEVQIVPTHTQLLTGLDIHVELIRSRLDRKPACSVAFETRTVWAAG
jgi:recombination protein RecA